MGAWHGKFIIGLTGNIATGKSIIRRFMTHLGAYGIDADFLVHRLLLKGAPGFTPVVEAFGDTILRASGEIDRALLGKIVFIDPQKLRELEAILHPMVEEIIKRMCVSVQEKIIVIEAIKLLESGLSEHCDSIWVADAGEAIQLRRLIKNRGMSEKTANQRMSAQPAQSLKITRADIIIHNEGTLEDLWNLVKRGWNQTIPKTLLPESGMLKIQTFEFFRLQPDQVDWVIDLVNKFSDKPVPANHTEVLDAFSRNSFVKITQNSIPMGILIWDTEKFIARIVSLSTSPSIHPPIQVRCLFEGIERLAEGLLCEFIIVPEITEAGATGSTLEDMGYTRSSNKMPETGIWFEAVLQVLDKVEPRRQHLETLHQDTSPRGGNDIGEAFVWYKTLQQKTFLSEVCV